ncbi:MAG: Sec-independent protein translocase protein TatB [Bosea sp. (in: a-proteobacteria)]
MFDIAWSKLMLIGVVALIVIGPKDLPAVLRTLGETIGKLRRMADEFRGQFNDAMREAELDGIKKDIGDIGESVRSATSTDFNPISTIREEIKGAVEAKNAASAVASPAAPLNDAESRALELKMAEERVAQLKAEQEFAKLPVPDPAPPVDITPPAAAEAPEPKPKRKSSEKGVA